MEKEEVDRRRVQKDTYTKFVAEDRKRTNRQKRIKKYKYFHKNKEIIRSSILCHVFFFLNRKIVFVIASGIHTYLEQRICVVYTCCLPHRQVQTSTFDSGFDIVECLQSKISIL